MLIADSHEFIELYRGDKDLRLPAEMTVSDPTVRVVSFAPERLSPNDRSRFGKRRLQEVGLPPIPEAMEVRLLPSISLRFAKKESGGIVAWMRGYGAALAGLRPDVIMENPFSWLTPRSYVTAAVAARHGIPVVYYDPGDDIPISPKHRVMAVWESPVVRRAARIITYNEAGKSRFIRKYGYPEDRIRVVPKPVDVSRWSVSAEERRAVRATWGMDDDALAVGYLGRLTQYKGSRVLLDVAEAALADPDLRSLRFVFIGGALSSAETEDAYRRENTIVTGMRPNEEVPRLAAALDVVVFPDVTHPGGFPTAVAEAMAAGRALVVGIGERADLLPLHHGATAMLVEPGSARAVLDAVRALARDEPLRRSLGASVAEYALGAMDYPRVAKTYLDLFEQVLENG